MEEGWGLTANTASKNEFGYYQLYGSDGTANLYEIDGKTMETTRKVAVKYAENFKSQSNLNELEFAKNHVYASVWNEDFIVKIDPQSGLILNTWNLKVLKDAERLFQ